MFFFQFFYFFDIVQYFAKCFRTAASHGRSYKFETAANRHFKQLAFYFSKMTVLWLSIIGNAQLIILMHEQTL